MRDLHNNRNIIIKPADKEGSIVIMNTADYVQEAHRQLLNPEHYKPLTSDPTINYNKYIHHLIDQAWRLGIITDTTKESLQTKNPRTSTFYMLPKNTLTRKSRKTNSQQYRLYKQKKIQPLWTPTSDNIHPGYPAT